METRTSNEGRDDSRSPPISPLSLSSCHSLHLTGKFQLNIAEFEAEPFSTNFVNLFDDLGFTVTKSDDAQEDHPGLDIVYEAESMSNFQDISSSWRYSDVEENTVTSSKRWTSNVLPTIHEDQQESHRSIVPTAALSDFEFDFEAFDRSTKGTTVCMRRDNGKKYSIKRKRAARTSSWVEQSILEKLTNQELPFIPRLCWSFYSGEHIYIITENLTGSNLVDLVHQQGPLSIYQAAFYAAEMVSALSSLHAAGIMHRDLEPKNIQLDLMGHIILTNFECATFVNHVVEGTQRSSAMAGFTFTPSLFRAPEIILGWTHDYAADCWSFGMVLYYMVFGKHPFAGVDDNQEDFKRVHEYIVRSVVPMEAMRLVHPMTRDLILKCLERNPALRWSMAKIRSHSYFLSVDWKKVSSLQTEVPILGNLAPRSLEALSMKTNHGHHQNSSLNPPLLDLDRQAMLPMYSPVHRRTQSAHRLSNADSFRDDTSVSVVKPLNRAMSLLQEDDVQSASPMNPMSPSPIEISCEPRTFDRTPDKRLSEFWDDLDKEDIVSAASLNSGEFGATTGVPCSKPPKIRKYRSAIQARSHLFSVSTVSFQNKMRRKPRSIGALRQTKPVPVIENLPMGIHQMGSGIGFNYSVPTAVPSKTSIVSFAPSCHLFQKGFSVRNLGLSLGNSSTTRMRAKPFSPAASRMPLNDIQMDEQMNLPQYQSKVQVGNGTFIREMYRSPSWILSPPESLPSPMALVNVDSPITMVSGSEPLSPATLVDHIEDDEECHVNITIPKSVELEYPLAQWAPDLTLRLVPQTSSTFRLPHIDSANNSLYMDSIEA